DFTHDRSPLIRMDAHGKSVDGSAKASQALQCPGQHPAYAKAHVDMHPVGNERDNPRSALERVDAHSANPYLREEIPMTTKKASAVWNGGIKDGQGTISTETGVLDAAPYGFKSRFEDGPGTNPEELIGAAHAGCFSMALSMMLGDAGFKPERIETHAAVTLEKAADGFTITASHLTVTARVPGADAARFEEIAQKAKAGCPVSKLLNANITMEA